MRTRFRALVPGEARNYSGRPVFWLLDRPIVVPSQRAGGSRPASGFFSTIVPSYSDGLAPDSHRLPAVTRRMGPPHKGRHRPRVVGNAHRLPGDTFLTLDWQDQYRGSDPGAIVRPISLEVSP